MKKLALVTLAKDEARYLEEWVAFHCLNGVDEILVYDDGSSDDTRKLIGTLGRFAAVTWINWGGQTGSYFEVQRSAFMDGVRRLVGRVEFVGFIDVDEFLYDASGVTLPKALGQFGPEISAIAVNQRVFGSSGLTKDDGNYVTSRFIYSTTDDSGENRWFKTIARPERIVDFGSSHNVILSFGSYVMNDRLPFQVSAEHPGNADRIGRGNLMLNHYMIKSREEYQKKQLRWATRDVNGRYDQSYFDWRDLSFHGNAVLRNCLALRQQEISETYLKLILGLT